MLLDCAVERNYTLGAYMVRNLAQLGHSHAQSVTSHAPKNHVIHCGRIQNPFNSAFLMQHLASIGIGSAHCTPGRECQVKAEQGPLED